MSRPDSIPEWDNFAILPDDVSLPEETPDYSFESIDYSTFHNLILTRVEALRNPIRGLVTNAETDTNKQTEASLELVRKIYIALSKLSNKYAEKDVESIDSYMASFLLTTWMNRLRNQGEVAGNLLSLLQRAQRLLLDEARKH